MHLKAIEIKERLLGDDDYEVALSVGHLASLYNYDMNKFDDAEQLYLRSIAIGQNICHHVIPAVYHSGTTPIGGFMSASRQPRFYSVVSVPLSITGCASLL